MNSSRQNPPSIDTPTEEGAFDFSVLPPGREDGPDHIVHDIVQVNGGAVIIDMDVVQECLGKIDSQVCNFQTLYSNTYPTTDSLKAAQNQISSDIFKVLDYKNLSWETKKAILEGAAKFFDHLMVSRPKFFSDHGSAAKPHEIISMYLDNRVAMAYRSQNALSMFSNSKRESLVEHYSEKDPVLSKEKLKAKEEGKKEVSYTKFGGAFKI